MEKLDRKTFVLIIVGIVAIVGITLALLLPTLLGGDDEGTPVPTVTETPAPVDETVEPTPTSIVVPSDEGAAPGAMYENDYSEDQGYTPLPADATASDLPDGTILDPTWANQKLTQLACELSTKDLVEEKALEPLTAFYNDLSLAGDAWGNDTDSTFRSNIRLWLEEYRAEGMGKRVPGDTRDLIRGYCTSTSTPDDSGVDGGDILEEHQSHDQEMGDGHDH